MSTIDANPILFNLNQFTGIFVGSSGAVSSDNEKWFKHHRINGVLNVAFDIDDHPFNNAESANISSIQFAKVSLVDTGPAPGYSTVNQAQTLIAAVQMLDQLKTRAGADYNVLVHCASGGSRSVVVAALWMAQRLPIEPVLHQTRFETALNSVRHSRRLGSQPYDPTNPNAGGYGDGKPMASHFYMAQTIDQTMNLFPLLGTSVPIGWPTQLLSVS